MSRGRIISLVLLRHSLASATYHHNAAKERTAGDRSFPPHRCEKKRDFKHTDARTYHVGHRRPQLPGVFSRDHARYNRVKRPLALCAGGGEVKRKPEVMAKTNREQFSGKIPDKRRGFHLTQLAQSLCNGTRRDSVLKLDWRVARWAAVINGRTIHSLYCVVNIQAHANSDSTPEQWQQPKRQRVQVHGQISQQNTYRGQDVGVRGVERKVGAPALQGEAAAPGNDARPEPHVVGVHKGHGISNVVHCLKAYRARAFGGAALDHVNRCPVRVCARRDKDRLLGR